MILVACMMGVNFFCVLFLSVRWKVILPLLNFVISWLRQQYGWDHSKNGKGIEIETFTNIHFINAKGWRAHVRCGITITFWILTCCAQCGLDWWMLPGYVLGLLILDVSRVLFSSGPFVEVAWTRDCHGVANGIQKGGFSKHVTCTGGVSLACYACGVLDFLFERYGVDCFRQCDFAGASSGTWLAACGAFAVDGRGSVKEVFDAALLPAAALVDLFPCGLLFVGCDIIEECFTGMVRVAQSETPSAYDAVTSQGKFAVWLFSGSLNRPQAIGRIYRLLLRGGPDFQSPEGIGALITASCQFPIFTCPRLSRPLQCSSAAMDGFFPGRGVSCLPVPEMVPADSGKTLLFDMSGGFASTHARSSTVRVLPIKESWETFSFADFSASSPQKVQELFDRGRVGAANHIAELDAAMRFVFDAKPLQKNRVD